MITKQDIQKLATLARIDVTDAQTEKLQHDLERILEYVAQLDRAETGAAQELTNVTGMVNVMTPDDEHVPVESDVAGLLDAAPRHDNGFVRVPSVWKKK